MRRERRDTMDVIKIHHQVRDTHNKRGKFYFFFRKHAERDRKKREKEKGKRKIFERYTSNFMQIQTELSTSYLAILAANNVNCKKKVLLAF